MKSEELAGSSNDPDRSPNDFILRTPLGGRIIISFVLGTFVTSWLEPGNEETRVMAAEEGHAERGKRVNSEETGDADLELGVHMGDVNIGESCSQSVTSSSVG